MKKILIALMIFIVSISFVYANVRVNVIVQNYITGGGPIYIGIYFSEDSYENKTADTILKNEKNNGQIIFEVDLPEGEYVIDAFQDLNNNGICDLGLFNIPKEPIGITKYTGGIPGKYNKLKIFINEETDTVIINLHKF
jgi:uncharacterized protein (DUF2141 family)